MEGDGRLERVERFFAGTGSTYDWIARTSTLGLDLWWKRLILQRLPKRPRLMMDQACGTGILTFQIARRSPRCRIIGVELRPEYLEIAKKKAEKLGIGNVEFVLGRAEDVLLEGPFDAIVSSYLAKYAELGPLISNAKKMLGDGRVLVMHDFTHPKGESRARLLGLHFKLLQAVGDWRLPQWRAAFHGLPQLLRETVWVDEAVGLLQAQGFADVRVEALTSGTATIVTARKPHGAEERPRDRASSQGD